MSEPESPTNASAAKKAALPALPPSKPKPPTATTDGKKLNLLLTDTEKAIAAVEPILEKCMESGDTAPIVDALYAYKKDQTVKTAVAVHIAKFVSEREKYTWMCTALKYATAQGAGEHKTIVALQSDIKLYKNQMDALEFIDKVMYERPRKLADLEMALNRAEEYALDRLEEAACILRLRDDLVAGLGALSKACAGDDYAKVDDAIKHALELCAADPASDPIVAARKRRELLFQRDGVARALIKAAEGNDMDALEEAVDAAKACQFPTTNIVYERASEKLATMRVAAEQKEKAAVARRLKNRFGDDADDLSRRMGSGKHEKIDLKSKTADKSESKTSGKTKAGGKFDPYNPKSGTLPELNFAGYSSNTYTLAACPDARTAEDFTKDLFFNKKSVQRSMFLWTADSIPKSILRPVIPLTAKGANESKAYEAAYNTKALKIFKNIQCFMTERAAEKNIDSYATEVMKMGHGDESIRDEIYAQLIKQTTINPLPAKCALGWQLIGLMCEAFPPTESFAPFVLHYLYNNSKVSNIGATAGGVTSLTAAAAPAGTTGVLASGVPAPFAYAPYCMHTLWNTMHEPLKHVTDFTLEHVRRFRARDMKAGDIRIYFLDGSEMNVQVQPWTRVCDSLKVIFKEIKLVDRAGFGIFQVGVPDDASNAVSVVAAQPSAVGSESRAPGAGAKKLQVAGEGREIWVPLNSCLLDYDPQPRPSVSPVLYRQQASRLVFKRRLYQDLTSDDPLAQQLLYYQTLVSICDESLVLSSEKQLLKVLALHRLIDDKLKPQPIGQPNMLASVAVKNILPASAEAGYNEKKKEVFFEKVAKAKQELMAGKMPTLRYLALINEVRELPLFGCSYFNVKMVLDDPKAVAALPKGLSLGVSSQGVFVVSGKDKKIHDSYPFYRVVKWEMPEIDKLTIKVKHASIRNKIMDVKFNSKEAEEIAALVTTIMADIESVTDQE